MVPSLAESLPYVVLEAAAAQLPVIATRVGGIAEIFGPTAASLVPANDAAALAAAMQAALDDPRPQKPRCEPGSPISPSLLARRTWPTRSRRFTAPLLAKA